MEFDDKIRANKGIAVSLRDMKDGTTRIFMDDVSNSDITNPISWSFDSFYTFTPEFKNELINEMSLSKEELANIGSAVVARLLALNGRLK